jgi:trimeric autotransporter adhesin
MDHTGTEHTGTAGTDGTVGPGRRWSVRARHGAVWLLAIMMAVALPAGAQQALGTIATVAGTGTAGSGGDTQQATAAQLGHPHGVAVDSAGNLYIADLSNNRVRKVAPNGTITTVAGTGTPGDSGDGGPATSAQLNNPSGVAVDSDGNLYIADYRSHRVRKVEPGGTITTVAGTGTYGSGGDGGPATAAQLAFPGGVAVDGDGNLYIADSDFDRVRKVAPGGTITTVAGTGTFGYSGDGGLATAAQLTAPGGVAVDGDGNLYIADTFNSRVRKVAPGGTITTVAGTGTYGSGGDGGPATAAQLTRPYGVAVDSAGNLYIADTDDDRVRKVAPGGTITTVAGTGTAGYNGDNQQATAAQLNNPFGVAVDGAGNLYIADSDNSRVRRVQLAAGDIVAGAFNSNFDGITVLRVKPNQTIPLQWAFTDGTTNHALLAGTVSLNSVSSTRCTLVSGTDGTEQATTEGLTGASGLQLLSDDSYQVNWKANSTTGCRALTVTAPYTGGEAWSRTVLVDIRK